MCAALDGIIHEVVMFCGLIFFSPRLASDSHHFLVTPHFLRTDSMELKGRVALRVLGWDSSMLRK